MSADVEALVYDEINAHVCARCLGVVARAGDVFRCANCGHTGTGHEAVCGCGWRLPSDTGRIPARFACVANPARSDENPSLIVVAMIAETGRSVRSWPPAASVHAVAV